MSLQALQTACIGSRLLNEPHTFCWGDPHVQIAEAQAYEAAKLSPAITDFIWAGSAPLLSIQCISRNPYFA